MAVGRTRSIVNQPIRFETMSPKASRPTREGPAAGLVVSAETPPSPVVLIDASNVARDGGGSPDIGRLVSCLEAARRDFPGHQVTMIADASLSRITELESGPVEFSKLKNLMATRDLVSVPPGVRGKADKMILNLASERNGIVVSNDSFKEFQSDFPWLFQDGRLFGHSEVPGFGWRFTPRLPVRPRTY